MGMLHRCVRVPATALLAAAVVALFALPAYADAGDPDTSFSGDGTTRTDFAGALDEAFDVVIQENGRPVAVGEAIDGDAFEDSDFGVARYLSFGDPDPTFSGDGRTTVDFVGAGDVARAVALADNGKIVVAGGSNNSGPAGSRFGVARLTSGGSIDPGFSGDGKVRTAFPGYVASGAHGVAIQANGKVVVVGDATASGAHRGDPGIEDIAVARYKAGGALDHVFGGDGRVTTDFAGGNESASEVLVTASGKILVAALSQTLGGETRVVLARYHANGTLDGGFSGDGKLVLNMAAGESETPVGLALRGDGKIVVGAAVRNAVSATSGWDLGVALVNANGTLAAGFGDGGFAFADFGDDEQVTDMARDSNGKLYFSATRPQAGEQSPAIEVFRLKASGAKSTPFGDGGAAVVEFGENPGGNAVALDTAHRAVAVGRVDTAAEADFAVVRLEA